MPNKLLEYEIKSLNDYVETLTTKLPKSEHGYWYRGVNDSSYDLSPSIFRHRKIKDPKEILELECEILNRFQQRSVPYQTRVLGGEWEHLFVMQHYRIPTRLLDWTENPFVALFFALRPSRKTGLGQPVTDASVWVLDPFAWNSRVLMQDPNASGVLSLADPNLDRYKPSYDKTVAILKVVQADPVAIYGIHNSTRIVAQQGTFMLFSRKAEPMEQIFKSNDYPPESLCKLVIPASSIEELRKSLTSFGYTYSFVFPDLEGLGIEIRESYGFEG